MNQKSSGTALRLSLDILLLGLSFFISVYIISLWHSIDLFRFFLDGFFAIILIKLLIILIAYKRYVIGNKANVILMIVAIYNLFSFMSLYLIQLEHLYEVCTLNFLIDVIFISIVRLFGNHLTKKNAVAKEGSRNLTTYISHIPVEDIEIDDQSSTCPLSQEVQVQEEVEKSEITVKSLIRFNNEGRSLIIVKDLDDTQRDKFRQLSPNCVIFDISTDDNSLQQIIEEDTFDSIGIYSKKISRLDFLGIYEILKNLSFLVGIIDDNLLVVDLGALDDVLDCFPLNIDRGIAIPNYDTLLIYVGSLCEAILEELLAKGVTNITIIDQYPISEYMQAKYHQVVNFIQTQEEDDLREELSRGYKRVIYGFRIIDQNYSEIEMKETIEKNVLFSKWILDRIPEETTKEFIFLSYSISNHPTTVLGGCFQNVEILVQSLNKYSKINYQVIRLPNMINKDNKYMNNIDPSEIRKECETSPYEVFYHLCSEKEVVALILSFMGREYSIVLYMGHPVSLPNLLCDLNSRGLCNNEESNITFSEYAVSSETYSNGKLDYSKYEVTEIPYGFILPDSDVDYLVASKVIKLLKEKVNQETDVVCRAYLGQLTRQI